MPGTSADIRAALVPRAFLHDDPSSYLAGVEDALRRAGDVDGSSDVAEPGRPSPS